MKIRARFAKFATCTLGAASILAFSSGMSFADTGPSFYPGETVDVYTSSFQQATSISLFDESGSGFSDTVPVSYVGQIQGNFTPSGFQSQNISWGTTWNEYSFVVPNGGQNGEDIGALLNASGGGVIFTRFVGFPDLSEEQYGTQFTYLSVLPTGQLPEVPWAAALPLIAASIGSAVWMRQRAPRAAVDAGSGK